MAPAEQEPGDLGAIEPKLGLAGEVVVKFGGCGDGAAQRQDAQGDVLVASDVRVAEDLVEEAVRADQDWPPDRPDLKASAGSTGGQLTVFTVSVDGGPPRHTHTREDESIYLFSGLLEVECDGEEFEAAPGSFVFLPGERPHTFRSVGGTTRGLLIITPGGLENYFDALHAALKTGDSSQVRAVQAEYGIRLP